MAIIAITEERAKHIVGIGQDDIKKINTLRTPSFFFIYPVSRCSNAGKLGHQGVAFHCCTFSLPCLLADCREVFDFDATYCLVCGSVDGSCVCGRVSWTKLTLASIDGIDSLNPALSLLSSLVLL